MIDVDALVWPAIALLLALNIAIYVGIVYFPEYTRINVPLSPHNQYIQFAMINAIDYTGGGCWHRSTFDSEGRQYCLNGTFEGVTETYIYGVRRTLILTQGGTELYRK